MKTFDVYEHSVHGARAVKQGINWPAFFFCWIWAMVKKMWAIGFFLLGLLVVFVAIEEFFLYYANIGGVYLMWAMQLAVFLYAGAKGNDWRRGHLRKRGFQYIGSVEAANQDAAVTSVKQADSAL
ncbi:DUF2628 domain-containing protein [Halomonas sp. ML-15]|uniref:DUF2628 domain-containing protein n=1 Tax=Halomonas sp. ML-15 TaxID=2773305 RepID=UPI001745DDAF|nr:DUF2628 domain-containing protein [Halomonas sp. ML-15]MBD3895339.1 DUF2628 domain-containing protein [Halomonas sp. ML-15]